MNQKVNLTANEMVVLRAAWRVAEQGRCYVWHDDLRCRCSVKGRSLAGTLGSLARKGLIRHGDALDDLCVTHRGAAVFGSKRAACFGCDDCQ